MVATCGSCGAEHDRPAGQRLCRSCHAAYMREWRKTHPLTADQRRKDTARSYAGVYKRRGLIKPEPCRACGAGKAEMHHPDYGRPADVVWLCRPCHLAEHRKAA